MPTLTRHLSRGLAVAVVLAAPATAAAQITFGPLAGANGTPYAGHVENGFTVTPTGGQWFEAQAFGSPTPSIYGGPLFAPMPASFVVQRTDGGGFAFGSIQVSSNTTPGTSYLFTGMLGGGTVFSQSYAVGTANTFETFLSSSSATIDLLTVTATPVVGVTSFNVDDIGVAAVQTVPEPGTVALLATGLVGVAVLSRRRRALA